MIIVSLRKIQWKILTQFVSSNYPIYDLQIYYYDQRVYRFACCLGPIGDENTCFHETHGNKIPVVQASFRHAGTNTSRFFEISLFHVRSNFNLPGQLS